MPDIDWSFDEIPAQDAAAPAGGPPDASPDAKRRRLPPPWVLFAWAAVLAAIALGAIGFTRLGWRQIETQIAAIVAYEDAQSLARMPALVLAVQSNENPAWLSQRQAEADLGLPAAQPAPGLQPAAVPPRALSVRQVGSDVFVASVLRVWEDSAGIQYEYALDQHYRSHGPGQWLRWPASDDAWLESAQWQGERLSATFPLADQAWMLTHLPLVDTAMVQACANWNQACPDTARATLNFVADFQLMPQPAPDARTQFESVGAYPVAFDIAPRLAPLAPDNWMAASPHLSGLPRDAAASRPLVRALAVRGFLYLINEIAGPSNGQADLFRDALAAREEIRQGLAPAPDFTLHPRDYAPPEALWNARTVSFDGPFSDLPYHLQALAFVDFILAGQPADREAGLLANLRGRPDLIAWLVRNFGARDGRGLLAEYQAAAQEGMEQSADLPWEAVEGLAFVCADGIGQVRDGQVRPLSPALPATLSGGSAWLGAPGDILSPDGRWFVYSDLTIGNQMFLLDRANHVLSQPVGQTEALVVGWSAGGELLYIVGDSAGSVDSRPFALMAYAPDTGQYYRVIAGGVQPFWNLAPRWTPDRTQLALTITTRDDGVDFSIAPALVTLGAPATVRRLADWGYGPSPSPNNKFAAFLGGPAKAGSPFELPADILVADLAGGEPRTIVSNDGLGDPSLQSVHSITWSPDGQWIMFVAMAHIGDSAEDETYLPMLFAVLASGGALRAISQQGLSGEVTSAAFSADGQYLAYSEWLTRDAFVRARLNVQDWATGVRQYHFAQSPGAAWSPVGSRLAIANDFGVYAVDAATGAVRWLNDGPCWQAAWLDS